MKHMAVFAILRDRQHTEAAVQALVADGFRTEDIAILLADGNGTSDFAHEEHSKAAEGMAAGSAIGAVLGGAFGFLAAIGTIVIPALQPYLVAVPAIDVLAGAGAAGILGGLIGAAAGLGIPEFEAKRYYGLIKNGRSLLSVHCENPEWVRRAKHVLKSIGGQRVVSAAESGAGFALRRRGYVGYTNPHGSLR